MSLTRVSLCCVVLLAWASYAPVHSQEPDPGPGTATLENEPPVQAPVAPQAPPQDYYYPEGGQPGYAPPTGPTGYVPLDPFAIRFSVRSDIGDGPGWAQGFQSINGFVPITFEPDRSLLFVNGRAIATNNGAFAANVGAGMRFFSPEIQRVFGGSFWYDYDDSNYTNYDQWGISLESLGEFFDVRLNAYIPSNDNQSTVSTRMNGNIAFSGDNITFGSIRTAENALRGGDLEIGGAMPFPFFGDYGIRSYIGGYYFQAPSVESTVGFKYRTEILVSRDIQLQIGASSDKLFGQNVYGAVTYYFPDGRPQRILSRQPIRERLYANVERNNRLNVYRRDVNEPIKAINPDTGLPYIVHHVDNINSPGTGDGTVKNPFGSLSDAPTGADIIFVHHNQVDGANNPILTGYNTGITLLDNQRLLGQGTDHQFVDLRFGVQTLPGNDGGPLPVITNPIGDVVTLANHNEVSGFQIGGASPNNPGGNGIFGNGITDFNINRNSILNAGGAGIFLDAAGTGSIVGNTIRGSTLANIEVNNTLGAPLTLSVTSNDARTGLNGLVLRGDGAGSDITATVSGNNFSNNTSTGMDLSATNGSVSAVTASSNVVNNNGADGIQAAADNATLDLALSDTSANLNTGNGLQLFSGNGGVLNVDASDNSLNNNTLNGLLANADGGTINFNTFAFSNLNNNTLLGASLNADNGGIINGAFASNSVLSNLTGGLSATLDNGSQLNMAFSDSQFNANTGFGISLSAANGSSFGTLVNPVTFDNIDVNNNVGPGILLSATTGSTLGFQLSDSTVSDNQGIGLSSTVSNSQANISLLSNTFSGNQDAGVNLVYSGTTTATQLIDGNTIEDTTDIASTATPTGQGLIVTLTGAGGTPTLDSTITNNTIQNNVGGGILINQNSGSSNLIANTINNNNILLNGGDALSMQLNYSANSVLNAANNTITTGTLAGTTTTGVNGVNLDLNAQSKLIANLNNNSITGSSDNGTTFSTGSGVLMNIRGDAELTATLTDNEITQNGLDGVHVGPDPLNDPSIQPGFNSAQGTAIINVALNHNLISNNQSDGVQLSVSQVTEGPAGLTGSVTYSLDGNMILNNGSTTGGTPAGLGVNAEVRSGIMNLTMTSNTISGNVTDGVLLRNSMGAGLDAGVQVPQILILDPGPKSIMNALLDGNTISNNGNRGVNIRMEDLTSNAPIQGLGGFGNVILSNNIIDGNKDEGVLVVTNDQRDDLIATSPGAIPIVVASADPFNSPAAIANRYPAFATAPDYYVNFANSNNYADLKFTALGNTITNNGGGNPADSLGTVAGDGMLILVGTASYVHADIRNNQFGGNYADDFRTDSFTSAPPAPESEVNDPLATVYLDHISLLDLRFTGNTGNSIGGVTSSSDSDRIIIPTLPNQTFDGRFRDDDVIKGANRRTDYFRVEDTATPVGSVLNNTNFFNQADSTNPRNNFLTNGYVQVPVGSLFP